MSPDKRSIVILLVEDDEGHALLIKENLRQGRIVNELIEVHDGQEALDYLYRRGEFQALKQVPLPGLILLDIKLPKMNGYTVLEKLKMDERLKAIPIVMLTSTDDQREVNRCYALGASSYITKPVRYEEFQEKVKALGLFLDIVTLPD